MLILTNTKFTIPSFFQKISNFLLQSKDFIILFKAYKNKYQLQKTLNYYINKIN